MYRRNAGLISKCSSSSRSVACNTSKTLCMVRFAVYDVICFGSECGRTTVRRPKVGNERCMWRMDDVGPDQSRGEKVARMERTGGATDNF